MDVAWPNLPCDFPLTRGRFLAMSYFYSPPPNHPPKGGGQFLFHCTPPNPYIFFIWTHHRGHHKLFCFFKFQKKFTPIMGGKFFSLIMPKCMDGAWSNLPCDSAFIRGRIAARLFFISPPNYPPKGGSISFSLHTRKPIYILFGHIMGVTMSYFVFLKFQKNLPPIRGGQIFFL